MSTLTLPPISGTSTLSEQLYEVLEEAIISGMLEPGSRLNPDGLAKHFGVSRIPVRESLRALDANGWVELRPRHGTYVRRRTSSELRALFEARLLLEEQVARLAVQRRTPDQLAALDKAVQQGRDAAQAGDDTEVTRINSVFHRLVVECADNPILSQVLDGMAKRVRFYYATASYVRGKESVQEHEDLVAAIRERDGDAAARIICAHIETTRAAVASQLDPTSP